MKDAKEREGIQSIGRHVRHTTMGGLSKFINALFCELGNKPPIPACPASFANLCVLCVLCGEMRFVGYIEKEILRMNDFVHESLLHEQPVGLTRKSAANPLRFFKSDRLLDVIKNRF